MPAASRRRIPKEHFAAPAAPGVPGTASGSIRSGLALNDRGVQFKAGHSDSIPSNTIGASAGGKTQWEGANIFSTIS